MLSLRNSAHALDDTSLGPWSLRSALRVATWPNVVNANQPISVRQITRRFSQSGGVMRTMGPTMKNVWAHVDTARALSGLRDRLRDPAIMNQRSTGLCGPLSLLMELARHRPVRYVLAARELLQSGKLTCPTGRIIEAEKDLRNEPLPSGIDEIDWLLAAALRDDANIIEDVDDDANGLETLTMWDEQRSWVRDVLDFANGGWETCFTYGETDCMKKAQNTVNAGGSAYFLIDACLLKDGGDDDEEPMYWRRSAHRARKAPASFGAKTHSEDDAPPPDHWVVYLGGFNLGADPGDNDPIKIRLWSWGSEFEVTGTVDGFAEYLYAVVTGRP